MRRAALPQFDRRMQFLTASIKRDAFIISRVTLAMNDLSGEFQKHSAIQKAYDRIEEAHLRELVRLSTGIQRELYQQLSGARGERMNLIELLNRDDRGPGDHVRLHGRRREVARTWSRQESLLHSMKAAPLRGSPPCSDPESESRRHR